jgi:hypothetical protein
MMLRISAFSLLCLATACPTPGLLTSNGDSLLSAEHRALRSRCAEAYFYAEEVEPARTCDSPTADPPDGGSWKALLVRSVRVVAPEDPRGAFLPVGTTILITDNFGANTTQAVEGAGDGDLDIEAVAVSVGDLLLWRQLSRVVNDVGYNCGEGADSLLDGNSFRFRSPDSHQTPLPEECAPEPPDEPGAPIETWPRPVGEYLLSERAIEQ